MSEVDSHLAGLTTVILAGGQGTRLREVLPDQQKVVAGIGQRPFVSYVLDQLAAAGVRRAVLCTGHLGSQVRASLGDQHGPIQLSYSNEPAPLGTAGALRLALPLIATDTALVLNGDSFCAADLGAFWRWHQARPARASLLLTEVPETGRYGQVQFAADGRVTRFAEKGASTGPGWISAGIYLLERALLSTIPAGRPVSIEREMFPAWIGQGLYAWPGGGRFIDIGTPASLAQGQSFFGNGPAAPGRAA